MPRLKFLARDRPEELSWSHLKIDLHFPVLQMAEPFERLKHLNSKSQDFLAALHYHLVEVDQMIAGGNCRERKVRAPQDRMVGNADRS